MNDDERRALRDIRSGLDWAATSEHAWKWPPFHVEGLHLQAENLILDGIRDAGRYRDSSPLGVAVQGKGGVGKTHLLGWVRHQVEREGGYFFLVDFSVVGEFWDLTARAMVEDLGRSAPQHRAGPVSSQVSVLMRRLAVIAGVDDRVSAAVSGGTECSPADLENLVQGLLAHDRRLVIRCSDTIRALALYAAPKVGVLEIGYDHLRSTEEADAGDRQAWGMSRRVKGRQDIVMELSMILALTGPSVIAIDQVDSLLGHTADQPQPRRPAGEGVEEAEPIRGNVIDEVATGLMALRHTTHRTLCLVACLPSSWQAVENRAVGTVRDRFRTSLILNTVPDAATARALVERRLAASFTETGFTPPSTTWPIAPAAFETAQGHTPRALLQQLNTHIEVCERNGTVQLLEHFGDDQAVLPDVRTVPAAPVAVSEAGFPAFDARFERLRRQADVAAAFDPEAEDEAVPVLLAAGLTAWIRETGRPFAVDPPSGRRPQLHARLRQELDPATEDQRHWAFRAIGAPHHLAALKRLREACAAAGIRPDGQDRLLIVLRNPAWSPGEITQRSLRTLADSGGRSLPLVAADLCVFAALQTMLAERHPDLDDWLRSRRPAGRTELLTAVLGDLQPPPLPGPLEQEPPVSAPSAAPPEAGESETITAVTGTLRAGEEPGRTPAGTFASGQAPRPVDGRILVGSKVGGGEGVELDLATLTRHTAIFAGSGSGKTVLIRRLVEECALRGVSSIVLDPNNDLARLGDPWPEPPPGWTGDDATRAREYLATTEVVVWTPGREGGRPLSFQPLPDLVAVRDDPDEFNSALDVAVAALSPRAGTEGTARKAPLGRAVLREALSHFARRGGGDFTAFLGLLADLPFEASRIDDADELAADLAQALTAATINDPLFAGGGEPVDPELLLTPSAGKRARVSVVSFVGLADDRRPGFVSQLQMALFSWIKRHPARDRPLGGLYVMDEAQTLAPATPRTVALTSTLTLASQARKYGLGLVFATQAPKGLHNQIAGNATTQFIGRLNSPVQVAAAQDLARARGGSASRVGRLERGQFYVTSERRPEALLQAPLCLSHHPAGPLTEEEVLERARR
ncbi:MAG: ATP-binding protein [Streptosporangiaceae bacterium]